MRKENRYLISMKEVPSLLSVLNEKAFIDEHCLETGSYFVITRYLLKWKNLIGKGKIRLKTYRINISTTYVLENKYNINGYSYKVRMQLDEIQAKGLQDCHSISGIIDYIGILNQDMLFFLMDNNLKMKTSDITVCYERIAYTMDYVDKCYRITIDKNLYSVYENEEDLLFNGDFCIVEIKGQHISVELLSSLRIDEQKNVLKTSKYKLAQNKTSDKIAAVRN